MRVIILMNKFIYKPNLSLREIRDIQSGERDKRESYIDDLEKMNKECIDTARQNAIARQRYYDQIRYEAQRHMGGVWPT